MNCSGPSQIRDVVVIGAGPAGCIAARELAVRGNDVLLVEARSFPRWKICGCCLGSLAILTLDEIGLPGLIPSLGGCPVKFIHVYWNGHRRTAQAGSMTSLSREKLDNALANIAHSAGADIHWNTRARIAFPGNADMNARVLLDSRGSQIQISARAVVLAAGLHSSLTDATAKPIHATSSHIGLGLLQRVRPHWLVQGELSMFIGRHGYAGCILTESGDVTWAAAVAPMAVKIAGGPGACVADILDEAGLNGEAIRNEIWKGTRLLTQMIEAQTGRLYRVGDAAGYVEPITGEGMSWAIASGVRAAKVIHSRLQSGTEHLSGTWESARDKLLRMRKFRCSVVASAIRHPTALAPTFALAAASEKLNGLAVNLATGANRVKSESP